MMNFKYLCDQYQLGRFRSVAQRNPGTTAQVWQLETDFGTFLVRTLRDNRQGELEWNIHQHLRSRGFAAMPAIVVPYFEQGGLWYQVQECLTGSMPNPARPGVAGAMAGLVKELSVALADYPGGALIHGDLGPWNLLQCGDGRLMVIDFGEACPGDPYFDYASLLAGVINHTPTESREDVCREYVGALNCDRTHLLEQLRCWAEQGVTRWSGKNESMIARFRHAVDWAEEHLYDL